MSKEAPWFVKHSKRSILVLYRPVLIISQSHYSPLIRDKATFVLSEMNRINYPSFDKARNDSMPAIKKRRDHAQLEFLINNWIDVGNIARSDPTFKRKLIVFKSVLLEGNIFT